MKKEFITTLAAVSLSVIPLLMPSCLKEGNETIIMEARELQAPEPEPEPEPEPIPRPEPEPEPIVYTYEYADLKLPSGRLWSISNLGAKEPWEIGDYFAWGETQPKKTFLKDNYKFYVTSDDEAFLTKYCCDKSDGWDNFSDGLTTLKPEDDAATVNAGAEWRMPTEEDWQELLDNCTFEWVKSFNNTGVSGCIVRNPNNDDAEALFFPDSDIQADEGFYKGEGTYSAYWTNKLCDQTDEIFYVGTNSAGVLESHDYNHMGKYLSFIGAGGGSEAIEGNKIYRFPAFSEIHRIVGLSIRPVKK